jgi:ribonuclease Z
MDHFAGFDQLLRRLLGREKVLGLFGPAGTIDAVEHKLKAYTWNLIDGYDGNFICRVTEIDPAGRQRSAEFSGRKRFERRESLSKQSDGGVILKEAGLQVRAATLDHGVPVLAFALEERARINVWRNKVEAMGLVVGPWLQAFKRAIVGGARDDALVDVAWADEQTGKPPALPLSLLKQEIMQIAAGRKIAYIVDCAFNDENVEKIVRLAQDADILFVEATFLDVDAAVAQQRRHLTARQAGTLARLARVKRMTTLHYSPRYRGQGHRLVQEAQEAFLNR